MASEVDARAAAAPQARPARARRARAAEGRRPDPRRAQPGRAGRQRRGARRRGAGAARVRARDRHPGRRDVHGQGRARLDDPQALGTVGLQSRDYKMAGFEDADVVIAIGYDLVEHAPKHWNPERDKKIVCIDSVAAEIDEYFVARGRADRRHLPRAHAARRGVPARAALGRIGAAARGRARPLRGRRGRRPLPDAAAARAVRDPQGAGPRRHPDLRRRPAQAVDRADVPGPRAEHGADRQRARGDGLRGAGARSRRSSCTPTATS